MGGELKKFFPTSQVKLPVETFSSLNNPPGGHDEAPEAPWAGEGSLVSGS
jgi:hypothetical protein